MSGAGGVPPAGYRPPAPLRVVVLLVGVVLALVLALVGLVGLVGVLGTAGLRDGGQPSGEPGRPEDPVQPGDSETTRSPVTSPSPSSPVARVCAPAGLRGSVAAINELVDASPGLPGFRGGDVGVDVVLRDGRGLWFFGDTVATGREGAPVVVSNSVLVFSDGCVEAPTRAGGGPVIPDREDGVGYWPMSVLARPTAGGDTVLVMSQRVRRVTDDLWGFEILGPSVAVLHVPLGGEPVLRTVRDLGLDRVDPSRPVWGAAVATSGGWVLLYGTARQPRAVGRGFALTVARVRPGQLLRRHRWTYWDGARWVGRPAAARPLIPEGGGVSQTLSVFEQEGRWFALSKRDDVLGEELVVWTAPSPTGPFDDGTPVARLPCGAGALTYLPLAHPDLLPRPGTVVVSWSRNSGLAAACTDPATYRPRFRRIRLPD